MTSKLPRVALVLGLLFCAVRSPGEPPAPSVDRPMFITIPPAFANLKRAPVLFRHDKHTEALKEEGCLACHPKKAGKFEFSFPIKRDERGRTALMNSFHDACVGCHTRRAGEHKKAGPVACGQCHDAKAAYRQEEYLPVLPEDYDALRDPYHKQCVACHQKPAKHAKDLDWKGFYVRAKKKIDLAWPKVTYDYYIHDKHQKPLEKKCELCHYLSPDLKRKLAAEGKEPTGQDWLRQEEEGQSWKKKESAHPRCLNCHLERQAAKQSGGPISCGGCHVSNLRPLKELHSVPQPVYLKTERVLIRADKASAAAVPFDHKLHITASRSCGDCHHDTLESCQTCHTLAGKKEGGFITLAEAYHDADSTWSCVGCHEQEKRKPDCAGCHHLRKGGLVASSCASCHAGKLESLDAAVKLPAPATLFPQDLKDELVISALEEEYEPTKVKHKEIATKLTEIANGSKLAVYFHKEETTVCAGCHHLGPLEKGKPVPPCVTCHTARNEPSDNVPNLLGAHHQSCLGCHKEMGHPEEKMPQKCEGCHKAKSPRL